MVIWLRLGLSSSLTRISLSSLYGDCAATVQLVSYMRSLDRLQGAQHAPPGFLPTPGPLHAAAIQIAVDSVAGDNDNILSHMDNVIESRKAMSEVFSEAHDDAAASENREHKRMLHDVLEL